MLLLSYDGWLGYYSASMYKFHRVWLGIRLPDHQLTTPNSFYREPRVDKLWDILQHSTGQYPSAFRRAQVPICAH